MCEIVRTYMLYVQQVMNFEASARQFVIVTCEVIY